MLSLTDHLLILFSATGHIFDGWSPSCVFHELAGLKFGFLYSHEMLLIIFWLDFFISSQLNSELQIEQNNAAMELINSVTGLDEEGRSRQRVLTFAARR